MIIKDRIDLAKYFAEKGFTKGAEIGVADGRYSRILCEAIPSLKLTSVDPWMPYEKNWRNQAYQDNAYRETCEKLKEFNVEVVRKTSIEGSLTIEDESLDFVFIDGSHVFDHVMTDIIIWTRKVKKDGIIAGHDAYHFHDSGVMEAVTTYTNIHRIELNIIPRNTEGNKDDFAPCWYFVKP